MEQILKGRISVEGLRLFAKKGLYPGESKLENEFVLSAQVDYRLNDLEKGEYLDYTVLAAIMKDKFLEDVHLLEAVAHGILEEIRLKWPMAVSAQVKIAKMYPHLRDDLKSVAVEIGF